MNWRRHFETLWEAYLSIRKGEKNARTQDNTEFLPAVLEVLETPPNPVGRWVLWALLSFLAIALGWMCLGHIDVVASAQGRIVPEGSIKTVQAPDHGVVLSIRVRDGQSVEEGETVIELDSTVSSAEVDRARTALLIAEIDKARSQALLRLSAAPSVTPHSKSGPVFDPPDGMTSSQIEAQESAIFARFSEYEAERAALIEERSQSQSERVKVAADVSRLEQQLPLVEQQLESFKKLEQRGLAPRLRVAEVEERAIGIRQDLAIRLEELGRTKSAEKAATDRISFIEMGFRREALDAFNEAHAVSLQRKEELTIATDRNQRTTIRAPTSGIIQQLQVHTIGAVVRPADPLLVVVPHGAMLQVDALVLNRDVGFVREGQPVRVKLEAFPFTRYGVIDGRVAFISRDAIQDEYLGLVFPARIELAATEILVGDQMSNLSSGMAVTAEIRTGRRRIIEFLLSPLARRASEAGRER
ncbi:HlyD family type I secretion membrane fusion protein [Hyphomonas polymorpha PS728]|uniref:Membrane fusion protein (MFP) family protein n=1 Tax=Hyphomonas polymorpha PS728 TaxID=1280954 RepID=A0A062VFR4_9PROT|nr:HlyD family type I secretion periplasmic adaptor subunit [Hyphomonas polymorpha]KCZ97334.1 HlyD family type I secretion membrane fusion protein [Hyphomonas polymorpha PS728]